MFATRLAALSPHLSSSLRGSRRLRRGAGTLRAVSRRRVRTPTRVPDFPSPHVDAALTPRDPPPPSLRPDPASPDHHDRHRRHRPPPRGRRVPRARPRADRPLLRRPAGPRQPRLLPHPRDLRARGGRRVQGGPLQARGPPVPSLPPGRPRFRGWPPGRVRRMDRARHGDPSRDPSRPTRHGQIHPRLRRVARARRRRPSAGRLPRHASRGRHRRRRGDGARRPRRRPLGRPRAILRRVLHRQVPRSRARGTPRGVLHGRAPAARPRTRRRVAHVP